MKIWPWKWRHPKVRAMLQEAHEAKKSVEATQPLVDEAMRRTKFALLAVEEEKQRAVSDITLLRQEFLTAYKR
jgi:hypothetical protein